MQARVLLGLWLLLVLLPPAARAEWPSDPSIPVPVFPGLAQQRSAACAPDGVGGLYVFDRPYTINSILAQRIDRYGAFAWPTDGIAIGYSSPFPSFVSNEYSVFASSDGAGGALALWMKGQDSLRIQRLAPGGTRLWDLEGAVVSDTCLRLQNGALISDGQGGAIAAWCERRSLGCDYYAQRMNGAGSRSWSSSGVFLGRTEARDTNFVLWDIQRAGPKLVSDGLGGVFVAFTRIVPPTSQNRLFVQHIDANGLARWAIGGLDVFPHELSYRTIRPSMCSDGAGGLIVGASGIDTSTARDAIWLQRLDRDGNRLWGSTGTMIRTGSWQLVPIVRSDGVGGAFVVSPVDTERVMIQHVDSAGELSWPTPVVVGTSNWDAPREALPDGSGGLIVFWVNTSGAWTLRAQRIRHDGSLLWAPGGVVLRTGDNAWVRQLACASDGVGGAFATWLRIDPTSYFMTCEARWLSADGRLSTVGVGGTPHSDEDGLIISPNPAASHVTLRWSTPTEGAVRLDVFDIVGRRVRTLWDGPAASGLVAVNWDGRDAAGRRLAAGVYLVRLAGPAFMSTKRIVLVDQ